MEEIFKDSRKTNYYVIFETFCQEDNQYWEFGFFLTNDLVVHEYT